MHKPTHKESNSGFNGLGQKSGGKGKRTRRRKRKGRWDETLSSEANCASLNEIN